MIVSSGRAKRQQSGMANAAAQTAFGQSRLIGWVIDVPMNMTGNTVSAKTAPQIIGYCQTCRARRVQYGVFRLTRLLSRT